MHRSRGELYLYLIPTYSLSLLPNNKTKAFKKSSFCVLESMAFKFDGLLFEFFSSLPTKAILKFTTISKAAYNLPSNDMFVKKQWLNMQSRDDIGFLLQNSFWSMKEKVELHPLIPDDATCYGLRSPSLQFLSRTAHILASSNGLLFCLNKIEERPFTDLFICNPATQSWLAIPTPDGLHISPVRMIKVVLDCTNGDSSMDYDLMVLMKNPESERFSSNLVLKMFSPREVTWNEVGIIDRGNRDVAFYHMPLYDKSTDTLYILSDFNICANLNKRSPFFWPYIVSCNMKNFASTRFLKFPKDARKGLYSDDCRIDIFKWWKKGDVCMVQLSKGMFRVWVLQQQEAGKWVRILRMRARAMMGKDSQEAAKFIYVRGFTVLNGKSLLFATQYKVYHYDLKGHDQSERRKGKVGDEICEHDFAAAGTVHFHSYSNTLRPCGDDEMPLDLFPV